MTTLGCLVLGGHVCSPYSLTVSVASLSKLTLHKHNHTPYEGAQCTPHHKIIHSMTLAMPGVQIDYTISPQCMV